MRGHNNVQGASDFGAMPNFFPGYQKVEDPEIRAKFEKAWGVSLPTKNGLDNHQMIDAIHDGSRRRCTRSAKKRAWSIRTRAV